MIILQCIGKPVFNNLMKHFKITWIKHDASGITMLEANEAINIEFQWRFPFNELALSADQ
jgi:hypothetical protein